MGEKDTEFKGGELEQEKEHGIRGQRIRKDEQDVEGHHGLGPEPTLGQSDEDDDVEGHFGLGPQPAIGP
jgi:hypothetical protein